MAETPAASEPRTTRIPRATYRLQLHAGFTFDDAVSVLPYLRRLGISHVYCSPIQRARPGSQHGYDIVAHDEINPELGGRPGFDRFSAALREHAMGQILDIVPNHMGVLGADNPWWMDVLESGEASVHAQHFDIDWRPVNAELHGKVLLPVLGAHYGSVLARGELVVAFEASAGGFAVRYFDHRFPVDPRTCAALLGRGAALLPQAAALLGELASASDRLLPATEFDAAANARQADVRAALKQRLAQAVSAHPVVADAIERAVAEMNAETSRDALHALLEAQAYRLAFWRVAADEINYRRFFDINELAALRMENPVVFEATQSLPLDLAAAGIVDGLRVDHPDGLHDPARYFEQLQQGFAQRAGFALGSADAAGRPDRPLYVVAEKIAAPHETVPASWHIHGTTGYRFANLVNGVLVDSTAGAKFSRIWHAFTQQRETFDELAYRGKRAIAHGALASELTVLATALLRIARADRTTRDFTYNSLRDALAEAAACMPVYRTYIVRRPSEQDQRYIDWAIAQARKRSAAADTSIFDFVRRSLLGQAIEGASHALQDRVLRFARRFQQFSAPVAAKGVEDTAFYRSSRLASLNEVGGDPHAFGLTVRAFHGASADRAARWPHSIIATSTHDNKRSEDVRNRIDVLSEMPATWRLALRRWRRFNRTHVTPFDAGTAPCASDIYLIYQTLLGTLPAEGLDEATLEPYRERIAAYALKAARESKVYTSWTLPNDEYEAALARFVGALLARLTPNPFLDDLQALATPLAWYGALNSLTMALVKFTSPGVPDIYQGNELMELSLVDPDNRRPVDYEGRRARLDELQRMAEAGDIAKRVGELAASPHDGRVKLWLTWRLLELRRAEEALFRDGGYTPLAVRGELSNHVIAYARSDSRSTVIVIAGLLFSQLGCEVGALPLGEAVWGDTVVTLSCIADGMRLVNVLTDEALTVAGGQLRVAEAFGRFPGGVLRMEAA